MRRLALVHAPTPLVKRPALDALIGCDVWIKRDDATGGAEAGNKVRKLEWLMGQALERSATHVVTCGGVQSNHGRATAIVCASLGLQCTLLLRVPDGKSLPGPEVDAPRDRLGSSGNVLIDRMVGAHIRLITPRDYADRNACMERVAMELKARGDLPYIIPEGGSNGLGSLGYVEAMREVREQLDLGLGGGKAYDVVVHACGSGGTAAGVALGVAAFGVADTVRTFAVCDDAAYFEKVIARVAHEARAYDTTLPEPAVVVVDDAAKGPGYGVMTDEQLAFVALVAKKTGVITDPVYTGKALFGLRAAVSRGELGKGARVLFIHTGGLPGLLAEGPALASFL